MSSAKPLGARRVLFVAYHFPPYAGVGSMIAAKTIKYLPRNGWTPVVLTVKEGHYRGPRTTSALDDLPPGLDVIRTGTITLPIGVQGEKKSISANGTGKSRGVRGRVRRLFRWLGSFVANPDANVLWIPFGVYHGWKAIRAKGIDVIYARSNPPTSLLVGALLKALTGKPLVVEIGDFWTLGGHREWQSGIQRRIQRWQERKVLQLADAVTTCFDSELYQASYPAFRHKFRLMMLGYDSDEFTGEAPRSRERFELTYVGKIAGEQYPVGPLLEAIKELSLPDLRLNLVGLVDAGCREMVERLGLTDQVVLHGFVDHAAAVRMMQSADALLLVINDTQKNFLSNYSTKLFEYLAARRPILALVPREGKAAELIVETGSGIVCSPRDRAEIREALRRLYETRDMWTAPVHKRILESDKAVIVSRLAGILEEVSST